MVIYQMSNLSKEFNIFTEKVKELDSVGDADKLFLYGLFKQATLGDCKIDEPGWFDFVGKAKWKAWKENEGLSVERAMKNYIKKVNELMNKR